MQTRPIKAAVFDIDGTLALMDKKSGTFTALPGAVAALAACRAARITPLAYTNGTFFPPEHYAPLLAEAGLHLEAGLIITPAAIAAQQLAAMGLRRVMVMGAEGTAKPLADAGIEVVAAKAGAGPVDAVMLGWTRDFDAESLEAVVQAVWDGAPAFAGSVAPYFAGAGGRLLGISGAIAAAVENATDTKVTVFGKPATAGLDMVTALTGAAPDEMVVIGDDPNLEIRMGRKGGALCIGVTTGIADAAMFGAFAEAERAHLVLPDLTHLPSQPWLKGAP